MDHKSLCAGIGQWPTLLSNMYAFLALYDQRHESDFPQGRLQVFKWLIQNSFKLIGVASVKRHQTPQGEPAIRSVAGFFLWPLEPRLCALLWSCADHS